MEAPRSARQNRWGRGGRHVPRCRETRRGSHFEKTPGGRRSNGAQPPGTGRPRAGRARAGKHVLPGRRGPRRAAPAGEAKRGPRGGLRSGYGSGGTLLSSPFTRFPSGGDVVTSFWSLASQFRVNSPRQQASGLKAALPPGSGGLCLQHPHWPERVHGRVPVAPRGHRDRPACQLRGLVLGIQAPRAGRAPEGAAGLPGAGWRPRGWAARGSVAQSQHRGPWPASVLPRACRPGTRTPASSPHMPPPQTRAHTTTPHSSYHLFSRKAPGAGAAQHHKVTEAARHLGLPLPGAGGAPHRPCPLRGRPASLGLQPSPGPAWSAHKQERRPVAEGSLPRPGSCAQRARCCRGHLSGCLQGPPKSASRNGTRGVKPKLFLTRENR